MALKTTLDAVAAICSTDPSITAPQIKAAIIELKGEGTKAVGGEVPLRSYSAAQVADLLGVSTKAVQSYARRGLLVPIYTGAGKKRARSYTGKSVSLLLDSRK